MFCFFTIIHLLIQIPFPLDGRAPAPPAPPAPPVPATPLAPLAPQPSHPTAGSVIDITEDSPLALTPSKRARSPIDVDDDFELPSRLTSPRQDPQEPRAPSLAPASPAASRAPSSTPAPTITHPKRGKRRKTDDVKIVFEPGMESRNNKQWNEAEHKHLAESVLGPDRIHIWNRIKSLDKTVWDTVRDVPQ